ncbi:hypothetical protein PB01_08685 [Psychrobacillus glaciei]|uniref:Uncharacterized protein n=1 Tax=Psychrobacillus glaciei TaxID=2283160 RepID=A0A5J6SMF2_9BACI|nr:hypothetical protein PB01_08685 [Psychrobacillus glaciei]
METPVIGGSVQYVQFSDDGKFFAFTATSTLYPKIFKQNAQGTNYALIPQLPNVNTTGDIYGTYFMPGFGQLLQS